MARISPLLSVASVELQEGWSVSWKTVLLPVTTE